MEDISNKSIVITGSNGKGSTASIARRLLCSLGYKTGLFTSPHLYQYNERFQINDRSIDDSQMLIYMKEIIDAINIYEQKHTNRISAFEAQYLLALRWFQDQELDYMVLEAGIGGRYDPVRSINSKVAALVSLDLEHTELLGNTLQEIALDKMDACYEGGTLICGETCHKVKEEITSYAELKDIKVKFLNKENWELHDIKNGFQYFDIKTEAIELKNLKSKLIGGHQLNNHAIAIELCRELLKQKDKWDKGQAKSHWPKAIEEVYWPGRLEKIHDNPSIYIDVGHTPDGVAQALNGFKSLDLNQKSLLVIGSSHNKKYDEIVQILAPEFDLIVCTAASHMGLNAIDLGEYAKASNPNAIIHIEPNIQDAATRAIGEAKKYDLNIYVAGGLFLATEFAQTINASRITKAID